MLTSVWVVSQNRRHLFTVGILALVAVSGEWLRLAGITLLGFAQPVTGLAGVIALIWVAVLLAKDVFRDREIVSADMIYGGINIYLLVTVAFAAAYRVQVVLVPDSIVGLSPNSPTGDFIYYSAVTITTLGYGDVSPVGGNARMLAFSEALFGQLFIAVLLAKLVATHIAAKAGGSRNQR